MDRREILIKLFNRHLSAKPSPPEDPSVKQTEEGRLVPLKSGAFRSRWEVLPNMTWTGEVFWAQQERGWCIKDGELQCVQAGPDRVVHLLTHRLAEVASPFVISMQLKFLADMLPEAKFACAGWRLGLKEHNSGNPSAILAGTGTDVGVQRSGQLFIGDIINNKFIPEEKLKQGIRLNLKVVPQPKGMHHAKLTALDKAGNTIAILKSEQYGARDWHGSMALLSHWDVEKAAHEPLVSFTFLEAEGGILIADESLAYGPVYFAQYTVANKLLNLTAQLAPLDLPDTPPVSLFIKPSENWEKVGESYMQAAGRSVSFEVENWNYISAIPYQIAFELPLRNGKMRIYTYEGMIAATPAERKNINAE